MTKDLKFSNYSRRTQIKALRKKTGKKVIDILGQKIDENGDLIPQYKLEIEGTSTTYKNINDTSE